MAGDRWLSQGKRASPCWLVGQAAGRREGQQFGEGLCPGRALGLAWREPPGGGVFVRAWAWLHLEPLLGLFLKGQLLFWAQPTHPILKGAMLWAAHPLT